MPRRYTSAIATASKSFDAGDATKVIEPFNIVPGQLVAVVARVSHLTQRSHLADQTTNLRGAVENRDGIVIEPTFEFVARSFNDDGPCDFRLYDYWPSALAKVARTCRRVGAVMLVESTSRYVRNGMCSLLWRKGLTARSRRLLLNTQPTDADFADLRYWTEGVRLMTLLPRPLTSADFNASGDKPRVARKVDGRRKIRLATRSFGGRKCSPRPCVCTNRARVCEKLLVESACHTEPFATGLASISSGVRFFCG